MTDKVIQNGTHIARYDAIEKPDHAYEAQVFVRLTREPDIAETYIPAGIYPTEEEALAGARERAKRALKEHEF
ncbi:hypothetical protein ACIPEN_06640 [Herbaspirillum chlorophenolicum]|jgi:non-canonical (house-cleaning) NTP pyrophosphatase|uniref:Uncharacterized protein n=1 Tax=Herbaspirillum chlorophenolicum TaxID=211589 RepID=A0ABW8EY32_9BURK|nr:hypothetical protein [Herbaspirillum chlorophenolicum]